MAGLARQLKSFTCKKKQRHISYVYRCMQTPARRRIPIQSHKPPKTAKLGRCVTRTQSSAWPRCPHPYVLMFRIKKSCFHPPVSATEHKLSHGLKALSPLALLWLQIETVPIFPWRCCRHRLALLVPVLPAPLPARPARLEQPHGLHVCSVHGRKGDRPQCQVQCWAFAASSWPDVWFTRGCERNFRRESRMRMDSGW